MASFLSTRLKKATPLPIGRGIAFFATRIRGRIAAKRRPGEMLLCPRWAKEHSKPHPQVLGAFTPNARQAIFARRANEGGRLQCVLKKMPNGIFGQVSGNKPLSYV